MTTRDRREPLGVRRRLALLVGGAAAGIVIAEGIARIALPVPQTVQILEDPTRARRLESERNAHADASVPSHPEQGGLYVETKTGRRLRANTHLRIENHDLSQRTIDITTNSIGYRNREIGPKTGPRILFLGDSLTFGDYLPEEDTFVRQVEALASARGKHWETINAGVGAVSLKTELAILTESGLALQPDAVVLDFYLNDFAESPGVRVPPLPAVVIRSRLLATVWSIAERASLADAADTRGEALRTADFAARRRTFDETHVRSSGDPRTERAAFDALVSRNFADWGGAWCPEAWNDMEPLFRELGRLADRHGFTLFLVVFPVRYQVDAAFVADEPERQFADMARAIGAPSLDLLPFLREQARTSPEPLFYDHCHHTVRGSRLIAEKLFEFLERNLG